MKMMLYCSLLVFLYVVLSTGQTGVNPGSTINRDASRVVTNMDLSGGGFYAGLDLRRRRRAAVQECTPILSSCPQFGSTAYYSLESDCNNIKGVVMEMTDILHEIRDVQGEADDNEQILCDSSSATQAQLDAVQTKNNDHHKEFSCMVEEMQLRRDAQFATANDINLPHTHKTKRSAPLYESTIPIKELQGHVSTYDDDYGKHKTSMNDMCSGADTDFYKDLWDGPYDHDKPDGQTSGEYYLERSALIKQQSNIQIKLYGLRSETSLIKLFDQDIVTAAELKVAVNSSETALVETKLFCKCCAGINI